VDADADQAAPWLWQAAKGGVDDAALMLRDLAGRKGGVALETVRRALRGTHWRALGGVRKIKAERANIRAGIGTDKEQVAVVVQGRELVALSDQQGWVQVAIPGSGEVGWVYESLLCPEQEP
jgi:SH3-like domain-containing protein